MNAAPESPVSQDFLDPRFSIHSPLRCDGPGSLDRGEDTKTKARIAIRWLPVDAGGETASHRVSQLPLGEALPRIHAKGRVGSLAYFAMDFPEGKLLSGMLGASFEALDESTRMQKLLRVGTDIAKALGVLHAQDFVHGELSPHSILFCKDGRALLWDVPLVLADRLTERRGEERAMTKLGRMAPSMSPEVARGEAPTAASDVFSLAAILCRAGGDHLPPGATTLSRIYEIASGRWLPESPESMPKALRAVLSLACNSEPAARPPAAALAAMLADVAADLSAKPVPAAPERVPTPAPVKAVEAARVPTPAPVEAPDAAEAPARIPTPAPVPVAAAPAAVAASPADATPAEKIEEEHADPITAQVPAGLMAEVLLKSFDAPAADEAEPEMVSASQVISDPEGLAHDTSETHVPAEAPPADPSLDGPVEEVESSMLVQPSGVFSTPNEVAEPTGALFGSFAQADASRWKSPLTWIGIAVAVILPATILVLALTSHSTPAKPASPPIAAAPAPVPAPEPKIEEKAAVPVKTLAPKAKAPKTARSGATVAATGGQR